MTNRTAATRYARALLDVAVKEKSNLDQIDADFSFAQALLVKYRGIGQALHRFKRLDLVDESLMLRCQVRFAVDSQHPGLEPHVIESNGLDRGRTARVA